MLLGDLTPAEEAAVRAKANVLFDATVIPAATLAAQKKAPATRAKELASGFAFSSIAGLAIVVAAGVGVILLWPEKKR